MVNGELSMVNCQFTISHFAANTLNLLHEIGPAF